jgi:AAA domain
MADAPRALTMLLHGASKSGKSSYSVTCPAPRLYMDVESASRFLAIRRIDWDPAREAPPTPDGTWDTAVVATRDWAVVERAYHWLASGQHPFRSLIIDSISELQQRYLESQTGRQQPTMQQWGSTFRVVSGLVRDIRDLTQHPTRPMECVVMTAMTRQMDGMWRPWVQGQLQTVLPYLLDVVGYLWVDQEPNELTGQLTETRKILTRRTPQFEAGERVDGKIPIVVSVTPRDPGVPGDDISRLIDMVFPPSVPGAPAEPVAATPTDQTPTPTPTPTPATPAPDTPPELPTETPTTSVETP